MLLTCVPRVDPVFRKDRRQRIRRSENHIHAAHRLFRLVYAANGDAEQFFTFVAELLRRSGSRLETKISLIGRTESKPFENPEGISPDAEQTQALRIFAEPSVSPRSPRPPQF